MKEKTRIISLFWSFFGLGIFFGLMSFWNDYNILFLVISIVFLTLSFIISIENRYKEKVENEVEK